MKVKEGEEEDSYIVRDSTRNGEDITVKYDKTRTQLEKAFTGLTENIEKYGLEIEDDLDLKSAL